MRRTTNRDWKGNTDRSFSTSRVVTDVDVDSDSDEGDSNDNVVEVSEQPPLVVDINLSINMADVGLAQDGTGQLPAAQDAEFSSKDGTEEVHRYFSSVRAAVVEFISPI